jgi:hypothetical protein
MLPGAYFRLELPVFQAMSLRWLCAWLAGLAELRSNKF